MCAERKGSVGSRQCTFVEAFTARRSLLRLWGRVMTISRAERGSLVPPPRRRRRCGDIKNDSLAKLKLTFS